MAKEGRKIWMVLGIGCATVLVLGGIVIAIVAYYSYQTAKQVAETIKNPAEKTNEVLGTDQLPPGYYPNFAMEIPFLMEMAIISNKPLDEDPNHREMGDHGFVYMKMIRFGKESEELEGYFRGETQDASVLRKNNINIDVDEELDRGVLEEEGRLIMYVTQRGRVNVNHGRKYGLSTIALIRCEGERRVRFAIWYGPESEDLGNLTGSAADINAFQGFISHFQFCNADG